MFASFTQDPLKLAKHELESAKRELLTSQSTLEMAQASVQYNEARIARLGDTILKWESDRSDKLNS